MPHPARLFGIVWGRPVHEAPVVPQHRIALRPRVVVRARSRAGLVVEPVEQCLGLVGREPGDRVGVLSDQEVGPAGVRVHLDQRAQWRLDVDAISVELVSVGLLVAHVQVRAVHAVATGVMRGETTDPLPVASSSAS